MLDLKPFPFRFIEPLVVGDLRDQTGNISIEDRCQFAEKRRGILASVVQYCRCNQICVMAFGRGCHQLRNLGKMVHIWLLRFTFASLFGMPLRREIPCPGNQQDVAHLSAPLSDCVSISSSVIWRSGSSPATTSPAARR